MDKLNEQYTEIVGVTHTSGEKECHDLMPQIIQLEATKQGCGNYITRLEKQRTELEAEGARLEDMLKRAITECLRYGEEYVRKVFGLDEEMDWFLAKAEREGWLDKVER